MVMKEKEFFKCSRCGEDTPMLRLIKYNYDFCVKCSDVKPKVGRVVVIGEGDYTATELDILDQDVARRLQEMDNTSRGVKNNPLEILDYDGTEVSGIEKMLQDVTEKALIGEDIDEPEFIELPDMLDDEEEVEEFDNILQDSGEEYED